MLQKNQLSKPQLCICKKCNFSWYSRLGRKPRYCAACKRVDWNKNKKIRGRKNDK